MYKLHTIRVASDPFVNYCYLGIDRKTKEAFVVDPAWSIDEILDIAAQEEAKIQMILLTHSHTDHTNKANELADKFKCPIFISEEEYVYYDLDMPRVNLLKHAQKITLGKTIIHAYLTPGHTKGSMCYKAGNKMFTGDTLFIEGCGMCDAEGGDAVEMYKSLNFLRDIISEEDYIYPGHAYLSPVGQKIAHVYENNIYMNIFNKNDFVKFRNRKNQKTTFSFV